MQSLASRNLHAVLRRCHRVSDDGRAGPGQTRSYVGRVRRSRPRLCRLFLYASGRAGSGRPVERDAFRCSPLHDSHGCFDTNGSSAVQWNGTRRVAQRQRRYRRSGCVDDGHREIVRAGYAYVAVSAQRVGVEGGVNLMGLDMSLKTQEPQRYAALRHPGDAYCYDIFSQAGRLVRHGRRNGVLRRLNPRPHGGSRRVSVGPAFDDLRQRRRPAHPGLRRLSGALPIRARRAPGRQLDIRRAGQQCVPTRAVPPRPACRWSPSSPRRTF
jgi:hypothetical protein